MNLLQIYCRVGWWKNFWKSDNKLVKLWPRVWCLVFLTHGVVMNAEGLRNLMSINEQTENTAWANQSCDNSSCYWLWLTPCQKHKQNINVTTIYVKHKTKTTDSILPSEKNQFRLIDRSRIQDRSVQMGHLSWHMHLLTASFHLKLVQPVHWFIFIFSLLLV